MMMCQQAVEIVTDEHERRLVGWRGFSYRLHMAMCPFCRAHRRQVRHTVQALATLPKPTPSEEAVERAAAAFKNRQGASKP